jgi:hypothetical protein
VKREKECSHEYVSISKVEEIFLKQNSRNQWLDLGDQNNFFFQGIVKVRNSKNLIKHLWDDDGVRVEERRIFSESYWDPLLIRLMGKKQGGSSNCKQENS